LTVHDYQSNDATVGDFLDMRADVACRGFAGQTHFWVSRRDFDAFLADLAVVREARSELAQLLGGWDDVQERLRLLVTPAGVSGSFFARVRIAETGPRTDQWHRTETEFVVPPDALAEFHAGLQRLADQRARSEARLVGDSEAIA
jgi:hypothetical protein